MMTRTKPAKVTGDLLRRISGTASEEPSIRATAWVQGRVLKNAIGEATNRVSACMKTARGAKIARRESTAETVKIMPAMSIRVVVPGTAMDTTNTGTHIDRTYRAVTCRHPESAASGTPIVHQATSHPPGTATC